MKKWALLGWGIVCLLFILWANNELYQHRYHIDKAKEAVKEYKYDIATDHIQQADGIFFHKKTNAYLLQIEDKKRESIMAFMKNQQKEEKEWEDYKQWVQEEVFSPVTNGFNQYENKDGVDPKPMQALFYQLNFKVEEKRIDLPSKYEDMHQALLQYVQKNQLAYAYWKQKKPVEAEKMRQEAITAHTDFLIAVKKFEKEQCLEGSAWTHHLY